MYKTGKRLKIGHEYFLANFIKPRTTQSSHHSTLRTINTKDSVYISRGHYHLPSASHIFTIRVDILFPFDLIYALKRQLLNNIRINSNKRTLNDKNKEELSKQLG
jgi:hypothetical protein